MTRKMPNLDAGARTASFWPAASLLGRTKASDHAIQQTKSSTRATTCSMERIIAWIGIYPGWPIRNSELHTAFMTR